MIGKKAQSPLSMQPDGLAALESRSSSVLGMTDKYLQSKIPTGK